MHLSLKWISRAIVFILFISLINIPRLIAATDQNAELPQVKGCLCSVNQNKNEFTIAPWDIASKSFSVDKLKTYKYNAKTIVTCLNASQVARHPFLPPDVAKTMQIYRYEEQVKINCIQEYMTMKDLKLGNPVDDIVKDLNGLVGERVTINIKTSSQGPIVSKIERWVVFSGEWVNYVDVQMDVKKCTCSKR